MPTDPEIVTAVERINAAWRFPLSNIAKVEYEDRLNGLDPKILNKAIDGLVDECPDRPSVNQIKIAYDKHRPQTKRLAAAKPVSPLDHAQAMLRRNLDRVMGSPAIDQIPTLAGKAKFRLHLKAVAFIQCQGATEGMRSGIGYSAIDACGYGSWGDDSQCQRMVRDWFDAGRQHGGPNGAYSAAALAYCKTIPEFQNVNKVREAMAQGNTGVKKLAGDEFEKAQQFHQQPA
ncbi:hypothetical protein [Thalassospira aquimaris]|uniref:Uncharacterized protein n=1 Tax=Thalassospira aquimaris TaxID=3037796 RepID=A0ABT6GHW2_9PROT|nr:hypothetical protein [Thalassospira sp. FZY0004]MDG4721605.1 hypothetical protein [Thalassospira sp. FZY0004]